MSLPKPDTPSPLCGISLMIGMCSLIHTPPALISRDARRARYTSRVHADAARP
jgi:hypothetical protein